MHVEIITVLILRPKLFLLDLLRYTAFQYIFEKRSFSEKFGSGCVSSHKSDVDLACLIFPKHDEGWCIRVKPCEHEIIWPFLRPPLWRYSS